MPIVGGGITGSAQRGGGLSTPKTQELINQAVEKFLTEEQVEALGYQDAVEVAALITPRIANFLSQAQIEALGYQTAAQVSGNRVPVNRKLPNPSTN